MAWPRAQVTRGGRWALGPCGAQDGVMIEVQVFARVIFLAPRWPGGELQIESYMHVHVAIVRALLHVENIEYIPCIYVNT